MKSDREHLQELYNTVDDTYKLIVKKLMDEVEPLEKEAKRQYFKNSSTKFLNKILYEVFENNERYEVCQAIVDVLKERNSSIEKKREYAQNVITEGLQAIADMMRFSPDQNLLIQTMMYGGIYDALEEDIVREYFDIAHPILPEVKADMNGVIKRHQTGAPINLNQEFFGVNGLNSYEERIRKLYPNSKFSIDLFGNNFTLRFFDLNGDKWELAYVNFDLVSERKV